MVGVRALDLDGLAFWLHHRLGDAAMTDQPTGPSAAALAAADAICTRHGMLPGGYMRASLAEALEAYALTRTLEVAGALRTLLGTMNHLGFVAAGQGKEHQDATAAARRLLGLELLAPTLCNMLVEGWGYCPLPQPCPQHPPAATMLGQPITDQERRRISADGP